MLRLLLSLLLLTSLTGCLSAPRQIFNITSYGALDNPKISSAPAFQKAIAACNAAGGGIVEVPAGHYLTGPLDMVSNMTLQLDKDSVILVDDNRAQYPDILSLQESKAETGPHPLLFANGLHNIAITGKGTIDGQGQLWWTNMDPAERGNARPDRPIRRRPPLVQIKDCDRVRIDGPTFTNSPFWAIHLLYSQHIDVGHCRIINPPTSPNTDALNTDSCRHVVVHDCFASVGDDGFGIKSGRDDRRPCRQPPHRGCPLHPPPRRPRPRRLRHRQRAIRRRAPRPLHRL